MARKKTKKKSVEKKTVETLRHREAKRAHIPTAEYQSVMEEPEKYPVRVAYERRNRDLDPQLVWRGKDDQDWSDLVTHARSANHAKRIIVNFITRPSRRAV